MTMLTEMVEAHLKAGGVSNLIGVSIGRKDDKATWRVDLADEQHRILADTLVASFDVAAADSAVAADEQRRTLDNDEAQTAKLDAQIQADLNMTPAEVSSTVDSVFAGFTAGQRTFLKRLVRMVLAAARKVLR